MKERLNNMISAITALPLGSRLKLPEDVMRSRLVTDSVQMADVHSSTG